MRKTGPNQTQQCSGTWDYIPVYLKHSDTTAMSVISVPGEKVVLQYFYMLSEMNSDCPEKTIKAAAHIYIPEHSWGAIYLM